MKQGLYVVASNAMIAPRVYEMKLQGDVSAITKPGQFVDIGIDGLFLRRPISVCDAGDDALTLVYKVVGKGTEKLAAAKNGDVFDLLVGLGNGFSTKRSGENPMLLGGGAGVPPLYLLAKRLIAEGKKVSVALGFNTADEIFYEDKFKALGADVAVTTADGSYGVRGFVTAAKKRCTYYYACGPLPMLKAVYDSFECDGEMSFEERMGCGFGACMGCSHKTKNGAKRICKEGPVLTKEEIVW